MKTFYQVLGNTLIATVTNNFVWFALIFWAYLSTKSVLATSISSGIFLTATALTGIWFGAIVDHNKKKRVMMGSSVASLVFFVLGLVVFGMYSENVFNSVGNWQLWILVVTLLLGVIVGNIRGIVLPTLVTLLVEEKMRDRANGMVGTVTGLGFLITSVGSGLAVGYLGMRGVLMIAIVLTLITLAHLVMVPLKEKEIVHLENAPKKIDLTGTYKVIRLIPGLLALILFATFNNFLGGVFMALMDAYGLSLMSVQAWGLSFGVLSVGFIFGGLVIAKWGLGKNPLRTLFMVNMVLWLVAMVFTLQPWTWLLLLGMLVWMSLSPFVEAAEHTIIQKVVPVERQGRVFGFAQSVEQAASPLTAFVIGPVAQFVFIPFMTDGAGVELIGNWFGTGEARGIALVFTVAGFMGLVVSGLAWRSKAYQVLSQRYLGS